MNIAVLGKGYLGKEFERQGFDVLSRREFEWNYTRAQLPYGYDVIINCIGKTDTRWCEDPDNFADAIEANANIPGFLSAQCHKHGVRLIHISTGCLYDSPYCDEETPLTAHCTYTMTKWLGEKMLCEDDIILRPRLLYSDVPDKNNFLCKLPNYEKYVFDAEDSFTCTTDIPKACMALLKGEARGVFNIASRCWESVYSIAYDLGLEPEHTYISEVRKEQGLHLVNCVMTLDKLLEYYTLPRLMPSIKRCYEALNV